MLNTQREVVSEEGVFADSVSKNFMYGYGTSNYASSVLETVSSTKLVFVASFISRALTWLFGVCGLYLVVTSLIVEPVTWVHFLIGLPFCGVAVFNFFKCKKRAIFDKATGYFYQEGTKEKRRIRLDRIVALQLIEAYIADTDGSYYCYQLNLVLKNRSRVMVVTHGGYDDMHNDAYTISRFLDKPIWEHQA